MLIWLASFPRSGNTFARNVLYQVYGLESTEVNEESLKFTSTYEEYAVVKTHLRPGQIPLDQSNCPVICLVRDGRDSLVSIAHHRTNIVAPGSDFLQNLEEATHAEKGSYFGGWGVNVYEWIQKAQVVIRFEDLILDPVGQLERLRTFIDLPKPDRNNLPTFSSQKFGTPKYGPQKGENDLFFRKGKSNGWKDEMPEHLEELFWKKNGHVMELLGYKRSGERMPLPDAGILLKNSKQIRHFKLSNLISGIKALTFQDEFRAINLPKKWTIQPEIVVMDTGVDAENIFLSDLSRTYSLQSIGILCAKENGEFYWRDGTGSTQSGIDHFRVVFSPLSRPDFLKHVCIVGNPKWVTWLRHPVKSLALACSDAMKQSFVYQALNSGEQIKEWLQSFIQVYDHRNRMHRVVSPFSTYLDFIGDLDHYRTQVQSLGMELTGSTNISGEFPEKELDPIYSSEWFHNLVNIFNKKDMELYQFYFENREMHK